MVGCFQFGGFLVEAPDVSIWQVALPDRALVADLHGFSWLDDLAAVGNRKARHVAQTWLFEWIDTHGRGAGPGWTPELAARRLMRWIHHGMFLLKGLEEARRDRFFRNLARQAVFLARRWQASPEGLPRFEALTGLILAGLTLQGQTGLVVPSMRRLGEECDRLIDAQGGIASRNPEELMEIFTLLNRAAAALSEAGQMPPRPHLLAIERIAPTLRGLRHADGGLARFHGGDAGAEGRLDRALAASGVRKIPSHGTAMGYGRLAAGRCTVIMDVAPPPGPNHAHEVHDSILAFELTSGRQPVIVNCGPGAAFGAEWRRAACMTPSHSTLAIHGLFSSRLALPGRGGEDDLPVDSPREVELRQFSGLDGYGIMARHDAYRRALGLVHSRQLDLSLDGRRLFGEDVLAARSEMDRVRFEALVDRMGREGVRFDIRFHLHPDVVAVMARDHESVSLTLKNGEVWMFRQTGAGKMSLDASVYLESGRPKPRSAKQVVLSGTVLDYASRVSWSLFRVRDGFRHMHDAEADQSVTETR